MRAIGGFSPQRHFSLRGNPRGHNRFIAKAENPELAASYRAVAQL
ncbi:hypothetical protein [Salipiger sp. PrR002]|nr:hypothetical protein [Salipiger sp. PrR002]